MTRSNRVGRGSGAMRGRASTWRCLAAIFWLAACDDGESGGFDAGHPEQDADLAQDADSAPRPMSCRQALTQESITLEPGQICDGIEDCWKDDDEIDCPGAFVCPQFGTWSDRHVIPEVKVCDGFADCYRAEDERDCPELENLFCAASGDGDLRVYHEDQHCDGHAACYFADDEVDCPNSLVCPTRYYGERTAIPRSKICDGVWDCSIDEFDCPDVADPFVCPDGKTIDRKFMCDQAIDCGGWADEKDPSCHQFACEHYWNELEGRAPCPSCSPWFIDQGKVCDGVKDCDKGDDERDCPEPFACAGGLFLRMSKRCDGHPDCPQADDEARCP